MVSVSNERSGNMLIAIRHSLRFREAASMSQGRGSISRVRLWPRLCFTQPGPKAENRCVATFRPVIGVLQTLANGGK